MAVELPIDEETKRALERHKPAHKSMDVFLTDVLRDAQNFRCLHDLLDELDNVEHRIAEANDELAAIREAATTMQQSLDGTAADDD